MKSLLKYDGVMLEFVPVNDEYQLRRRIKTNGTVTLYDVSNKGNMNKIGAFRYSFSSGDEVMAKFDEWSGEGSDLVRLLSS